MQTPTHPCLQIRNAQEAHILMEAVRQGLFPIITRRLSTKERQEHILPGAVFVWEESDYRGGIDRGGIERWTDGIKWSQSRMHEPFLLYEEKAPLTKEEEKELRKEPAGYTRSRRQSRPNKIDGLTKQTYSALLESPGDVKPRKWHLTCYFKRPEHIHLPCVEHDIKLRDVHVPQGMFVTAKGLTRRPASRASRGSGSDRESRHSQNRVHPGGMPVSVPSIPSLPMPMPMSLPIAMPLMPANPNVNTVGNPNPNERNPSASPMAPPHSPYDPRWGSPPWSSGSASNTSTSPLTPPAYGLQPSPHMAQQGYPYVHYAIHPQQQQHQVQVQIQVAQQSQSPHTGYMAQSPLLTYPPNGNGDANCSYHIFPSSPPRSTTLPPIRTLTRHLPHPSNQVHIHPGLAMSQPMPVSTVFSQQQQGQPSERYDPRNGYYLPGPDTQ